MKKVKNVLFLALLLFIGAQCFGQVPVNKYIKSGQMAMFADTVTQRYYLYPKSDLQIRYREGIDLTIYSLSGRAVVCKFTPSNVEPIATDLLEAFLMFWEDFSYGKVKLTEE